VFFAAFTAGRRFPGARGRYRLKRRTLATLCAAWSSDDDMQLRTAVLGHGEAAAIAPAALSVIMRREMRRDSLLNGTELILHATEPGTEPFVRLFDPGTE